MIEEDFDEIITTGGLLDELINRQQFDPVTEYDSEIILHLLKASLKLSIIKGKQLDEFILKIKNE